MKNEDNLARDGIKESWNNYFHKLYNENKVRNVGLDEKSLPRDTFFEESRSQT